MNHRSLAFRLAAWYALLMSATFGLVGAGMFYGLTQYVRASLGDSLRRRSVQVEQILQQAPMGVTDTEIADSINTRVAPDFNNRFVRVTRPESQSSLFSILDVGDTGIGIPAAAVPDVFERFFRVDEARSREDGGAGLGLSIAKSICSAHGAQIHVDSQVGQGSRFCLMFPRLPKAVVRGAAQAIRGEHGKLGESGGVTRDLEMLAQTSHAALSETDKSDSTGARHARASL